MIVSTTDINANLQAIPSGENLYSRLVMLYMKKVLYSTLFVLAITPILESCKKGDGDPAISFRTRKARLTGTWVADRQISDEAYRESRFLYGGYDYTKDSIIARSYAGGYQDESTSVLLFGTPTYENSERFVRSYEVTFDRQNTYESLELKYHSSGTLKERTFETGRWAFLEDNQHYQTKNRECVALTPTGTLRETYNAQGGLVDRYETSYLDDPDLVYVWKLEKLSNNQLDVHYQLSNFKSEKDQLDTVLIQSVIISQQTTFKKK